MMTKQLRHLASCLFFVLLQGLILNRVSILGYATPMVCLFFLLTFRRGSSRAGLIFWGFVMGLFLDLFTNTPGVGAGALTLSGLLQPVLLEISMPRDGAENMKPSIQNMGLARFCNYLFMNTLLFYLCYYLLLAFNLTHWHDFVYNVLGGTAFTMLLMLGINSLTPRS